jgi:hypothetical protein
MCVESECRGDEECPYSVYDGEWSECDAPFKCTKFGICDEKPAIALVFWCDTKANREAITKASSLIEDKGELLYTSITFTSEGFKMSDTKHTEIAHSGGKWEAIFNDHPKMTRWEIWARGKGFRVCPVNCAAMDEEHNEANAKRIAACVNACEGIPTSSLEAGCVKDMLDFIKKTTGRAYALSSDNIEGRAIIAKIEGRE